MPSHEEIKACVVQNLLYLDTAIAKNFETEIHQRMDVGQPIRSRVSRIIEVLEPHLDKYIKNNAGIIFDRCSADSTYDLRR